MYHSKAIGIMEKRYLIYIVTVFAGLALLPSCDLTETQKSSADAALIFGSETGLSTYCNSFYDLLPNGSNAHHKDDMADYFAKTSLERYETGALTPDTQGNWDWSDIRNVNYFLDHNHYTSVPENIRNNYSGIARFFRAWLYFNKLYNYGEVPWIGHVLNPGDPELTAPRDSRDVIIQHIIEDCDYAYEHILADNSSASQANFVNKWCALLLKARVCLFEASWRKYHAGTDYVAGCAITSEKLFSLAEEAAATVISSGPFGLHTDTAYKEGRGSYRDLFSSDVVPTDEVMLSISTDAELSVGYANYYYNVQATRGSLTRPFVNTYLNIDGSFYSETKADGKYKTFLEETTGRDLRLNQTIRAYDYTRKNGGADYVRTTPNYGYTLTGYQITKYTLDDSAYDVYGANGNDIPVMRYAEVLLIYAEAKAELGTLTNDDWKKTIGALRRRAGITGGDLDTKPTTADSYLKNTFYPGISDPVLLEIRRERTCELCLEGFRMYDLKRWACGGLWQSARWTGVLIPGTNQPLDMNGDGVADVFYTTGDHTAPPAYATIAVSLPDQATLLSVPGGYVINYNLPGRAWNDNMYLDPISTADRTLNPNLGQNPGY